MAYSKCKRMTVYAMGMDKEGNTEYARNGNPGRCRDTVGTCGCTHAEARLLKKMPKPVVVSVSHAPCLECAKALVNAGVEVVTYLKPYRLKDGVEHLDQNGVLVFSCTGE
jgi:deoxycytidylate deaminase